MLESGIDFYLDFIIKNKKINKFFTNIIINIGRKKDLDYFIENEELSKSQKLTLAWKIFMKNTM